MSSGLWYCVCFYMITVVWRSLLCIRLLGLCTPRRWRHEATIIRAKVVINQNGIMAQKTWIIIITVRTVNLVQMQTCPKCFLEKYFVLKVSACYVVYVFVKACLIFFSTCVLYIILIDIILIYVTFYIFMNMLKHLGR